MLTSAAARVQAWTRVHAHRKASPNERTSARSGRETGREGACAGRAGHTERRWTGHRYVTEERHTWPGDTV